MNTTIKFLSALVISLTLLSCNDQAEVETTAIEKSISKIEVLDFHSTHRCMTCNAIEENTKYTLDTYFQKEMLDHKITFQTVNVDEAENEEMAIKFEAAGTALFLNVIKDGKEKHIDLTDFAFMNGNDQTVFSKELKALIDTELKML